MEGEQLTLKDSDKIILLECNNLLLSKQTQLLSLITEINDLKRDFFNITNKMLIEYGKDDSYMIDNKYNIIPRIK